MEKESGSWFYHQRTDWRSTNLNSSTPFNLGAQNTVPAYANPCANIFLTNGTPFPHSKACQPNEPRGWFYCLPRFRQAFSPLLNSVQREKLPEGLIENCKGDKVSNLGSGHAQKRFLVFDRSGDQTTFLFSSGIGGPVQYSSWNQLIDPSSNMKKEEPETRRETFHPFGPFLNGEYNQENQKDGVGSEMQEDSEEIDALLYSDDDDDDDDDDDYDHSEDEEITSTGHSPSTVTAYCKEESTEESGEQVGSSNGPTKRQKLSNGGYSVPSLMDTASSTKSGRCFEHEDDAESCCGDRVWRELGSLSGKKRLRKERIRETLSVLESIIPGGNNKGKDAIGVIDEAIHYLRSLKVKAKALGFGSLSDASLAYD